MTPEKYFKQIFRFEEKVESERSERQAIRDTVLGATSWEENPTFSNQFHSTTENAAIKLALHNDLVNKSIDELVDLKIQIAGEIDHLEVHNHRMVLRERYLRNKKWEQVHEKTGYDPSWLTRLHKRALKEFAEKFPEKFV